METPVKCIICLGSNYKAETNLSLAEKELSSYFPDIHFGHHVPTAPEGESLPPDTPYYINVAASFTTAFTIEKIKQLFKDIEKRCGRTPESKSSGIIPLDIDLLTYGSIILKPHDLSTEYVRIAISGL